MLELAITMHRHKLMTIAVLTPMGAPMQAHATTQNLLHVTTEAAFMQVVTTKRHAISIRMQAVTMAHASSSSIVRAFVAVYL